MPIEFRCPQCEKLLRTPDGTSGRQAKCPQCGALTTIPETSTAAAAAAPLAAAGLAPPSAPNPYQSPAVDQVRAVAEATGPHVFSPTRIDLGDVMGKAWRVYRNNFGVCLGASLLVPAIQYAVVFALTLATYDMSVEAQRGIGVLGNLVAQLLQTWLSLGLMIFLLKVARGEPAMFSEIFSGGPYLLRGIGVNILLGIAVFIGFLLLVIPAFIAATMFAFAFLIVVDQQAGVFDAMRMSRMATHGNKLTLFALWLLSIVISVAGVLACFVGIIFVIPYLMVLYVVSYLCATGQTVADGAA